MARLGPARCAVPHSTVMTMATAVGRGGRDRRAVVYHQTRIAVEAERATAVVWLVIVLRGRVPPWAGWASTAIDVLAVLGLCVASGAATAWVLPGFFQLPVSAAFPDLPAV